MKRKSVSPSRSGKPAGRGRGSARQTADGSGIAAGISAPARSRPTTTATRDAILNAALDEFAANGFAAARLDDVARRAGVAKGTIYVHFRDKETLFEEIVRAWLGPIAGALAGTTLGELSFHDFIERLALMFVRDILQTRRKDVLRLIITEGGRFPQLAHVYYRDVIKHALAGLRQVTREAIERGEISSDALVRFPHLLVAPGILAVVWEALFARFEPLDAESMMREHVALLYAALRSPRHE
jgi:AcrR family transcriptional regulator